MSIRSLREYVEALQKKGEVNEVNREVDWNLEMGLMTRRCYETGAPVPLFTNVKGSPGFRAAGALHSESGRPGQRWSRVALSVGLEADAHPREIIDHLVAARERDLIPPRVVEIGPCKQNKLFGADVDLSILPCPIPHNGDGGRYLNTLGMIVCQTPDGSWTSWSVARVMIIGKDKGAGVIAPFQHVGMVMAEWRKIGKDMPFAIALGVEPAAIYAAGAPLPDRMSEVDFTGALVGEPIEVVPCETVPLHVPASTEIVIEGHVSITELGLEGPMGEYGGYIHPPFSIPQPVYNVSAMTWQDDAIFPFAIAGEPPEEDHTITGVMGSMEVVALLREAGVPVSWAWHTTESAIGWLAIAVPDTWSEYEPDAVEFCKKVADIAWATKAGDGAKTVIVVNDDIDVADLRTLVWAIDGRNDRGERGQIPVKDRLNWPVSPYLNPDFGNYPAGWKATRLVMNCLPPEGVPHPPRTAFEINCPKSLKEKILANWESDGFPEVFR
ncbi:MAG TPA: UbiD family decarboxylase [Nocardioidaceae bacterium]|nr:UbiD family decarboxylase [Nocardioidaceae bacterium]